jgi:hypothetical protein
VRVTVTLTPAAVAETDNPMLSSQAGWVRAADDARAYAVVGSRANTPFRQAVSSRAAAPAMAAESAMPAAWERAENALARSRARKPTPKEDQTQSECPKGHGAAFVVHGPKLR